MSKTKGRALLACLLLVLIGMWSFPFCAFAGEETGGLYLKCSVNHSGQRILLAGDEYSLVCVADAQTKENPAEIRYTTRPAYAFADCDWSALTAGRMNEKARELAQHKPVYDQTAAADAQGLVSFEGLHPGMYLVVRTKTAPNNAEYTMEPFLISIPMLEEGKLRYTISAAPKFGWDTGETPAAPIDPSQPTIQILPQTGQLKWPIPLGILAGIVLIAVGIKPVSYTHLTLPTT